MSRGRLKSPGPNQYERKRLRSAVQVDERGTWHVRVRYSLTDLEMLDLLATYAVAFDAHLGPDLAPEELYDRVKAFLAVCGLDAVLDVSELPLRATGWARRAMDAYIEWRRLSLAEDDERRGMSSRRLPRD